MTITMRGAINLIYCRKLRGPGACTHPFKSSGKLLTENM